MRDVVDELRKLVPEQIEFNIRGVERRKSIAAFGHQPSQLHCGLRSAQISDDGHDEILALERAHELKVVLGDEKIPLMSLTVGFEEQLAVRRVIVSRSTAR